MKTVLFMIESGAFGGLQVRLLDWLSGIDYSATSVVLASHHLELFSQKLAERGIPAKCLDLPSRYTGTFWQVLPKWIFFFSLIRPQKVVLLEGEGAEFDMAAVLVACWFSKRNIFFYEGSVRRPPPKTKSRLHFGFLPGLGLWRYKRLWNVRLRGYLARQIMTGSQGSRDKLITYYGRPSKADSVLYHGVDIQRFCPSRTARTEFRRANGIPEDATVIVSHGRVDRNKRVDRIIEAFQTLSTEHDNLWLLLTDYGAGAEPLKQVVAGIHARDRVRLLGFNKDVYKVLQASDLYVLASESDSFGIALIEAMSTGLVCVATNTTGPPEIITDGHDGFLVGNNDQSVLDGLRRALELGDTEKESMRRQARITVAEKFDLRRAVRRSLESLQIASRTMPVARAELTTPSAERHASL